MATTLPAIKSFVDRVTLREGSHDGRRVIEVLDSKKVVRAYLQASPTVIKSYDGAIMNRGKERRHSTSWSQTPQDVMQFAQSGVANYIIRVIQDANSPWGKSL